MEETACVIGNEVAIKLRKMSGEVVGGDGRRWVLGSRVWCCLRIRHSYAAQFGVVWLGVVVVPCLSLRDVA